jgi:predicted dehydrogenase
MLQAARKSGLINMVNYSKRNSSGLQHAARLVREGGIGRIMHVEASYLQSWLVTGDWGDWRTNRRFTWRLSTKHGSSGVLGDLGCHIFDMAVFLCGDIAELFCRLETYDKGIAGNRIGEYELDANDSLAATVQFANGALGTIHSTRWAPGFINREFVRAYGDRGSVEVDFDKSLHTYQIFRGTSGEKWQTVKCEATSSNYDRFIGSIETGDNDESDFENGYKIQAYLQGCVQSNKLQKPVKIKIQTEV